MKLIECHIENFGKLQNMDMKFSEGIHVICEKNGWGKSTLASFLKVMFYGFENERSRDDFSNERKRFRPWQGGVYGGSVTFQARKKTYILTRVFGLKEKEDIFSLKDAGTNLDSEDFTSNIGEELFQIDRASFERTIFLSQNDCETKATGSINAKIGNLVENTDDINNYEKADIRLNDILNSLSPSRKTGTLYKMKEDIAGLEMSIRTGIFKDKNMERLSDTFYNQFLERKEETDIKRSYFGPEIPSKQDLLTYLDLCGKLKAKEKMVLLQKEQEIKAVKMRKNTVMRSLLLTLIGIVCILAGILLNVKTMVGTAVFFVGVILSAIGIAFILRNGTLNNISQDTSQEEMNHLRNKIESFLDNYGFVPEKDYHSQLLHIFDKLQEYEKAYLEYEKARGRMDQFELEYESAKKEYLDGLDSDLNRMKEEYQQLSEQYKRLKKTREYLGKAKEAFIAKYRNPLMKGFSKYYSLLTGEDDSSYIVDANIDLSVKEYGLVRETKYLSAGTKDLTGICMRMALVEAMYEGEKPFLILDDPFVNLDGEKTSHGLDFLEAVGKEYQLIYFTCHESRKK